MKGSVNKYIAVVRPIGNTSPGLWVLNSKVALPELSKADGSVHDTDCPKEPSSVDADMLIGHPRIVGVRMSTIKQNLILRLRCSLFNQFIHRRKVWVSI